VSKVLVWNRHHRQIATSACQPFGKLDGTLIKNWLDAIKNRIYGCYADRLMQGLMAGRYPCTRTGSFNVFGNTRYTVVSHCGDLDRPAPNRFQPGDNLILHKLKHVNHHEPAWKANLILSSDSCSALRRMNA
jgi:hypothetical protein